MFVITTLLVVFVVFEESDACSADLWNHTGTDTLSSNTPFTASLTLSISRSSLPVLHRGRSCWFRVLGSASMKRMPIYMSVTYAVPNVSSPDSVSDGFADARTTWMRANVSPDSATPVAPQIPPKDKLPKPPAEDLKEKAGNFLKGLGGK